MAQDLLIGGGDAGLPAYLKERYAGRDSDVMDVSIAPPALLITGKVWTVRIGSESIVMKTKDTEGNAINVQTLPMVILNYAKVRGRSYYAASYNPDNPSAPDCWSADSIVPDASIAEPISTRCTGCPMSVKGSSVTDNGKAVVACGQHRLLAVIPAKRLDGQIPPLRLRLAQTSEYDGQSRELQEDGWFAFSNFLSFLKTRGVEYLYGLVVKVTFDSNAAYPKLLFKADRWLSEDEADQVDKLRERPEIMTILGEASEMPEGGRALPPPKQEAAAAAPKARSGGRTPKEAKAPKPAETAAPSAAATALNDETPPLPPTDTVAVVEEDEDDKLIREAQERKAAKAKEAAAAKGANGAAKPTTAAKSTTAAKPAAAKADTAPAEAPEVSPSAAALLGEWD